MIFGDAAAEKEQRQTLAGFKGGEEGGEKKDKYYILKLSKLVTGSDEREERFRIPAFLSVSSTRAEGASEDSPAKAAGPNARVLRETEARRC